MTNVAYYSACTEYEPGWGVRPDGYIVCLNKEFLQAKVTELNNRPRSQHGWDTYDKSKLCIVTEEMWNKLTSNPEHGYVWAPNNRSTWVVEE